MKPLGKLFKKQSRWIRIYVTAPIYECPYEKNINQDESEEFYYSIQAIVSDIPSEKLVWKIPGIQLDKAVELLIEAKYLHLIRESSKIEIDDDYYGYRHDVGRATLVNYGDYATVVVEIKKT